MKKNCYYYFLFELTPRSFVDIECIVAWDLEIALKDKSLIKMAFLTYPDTNPAAIRFTLPDIQEETIPESYLNMIQEAKEHFLSIYKLNYDRGAHFEIRIWNFDFNPSMSIESKINISPPDTESLKNALTASFAYRHTLKLISDSQEERLPIQYRYLSLFLFLEEEFKSFGKWNYSEANKSLEFAHVELKKLGHSRKPLSTFIDIRDRCAHIKSDKNVRGITQLSNKDAILVESVLPILSEACRLIFNSKTNGTFELRSYRKDSDA